MTNVEYRCPNCNGRLFAAPGGTRMRCPKCDQGYQQTEDFQGVDRYSFRDEAGKVHITNPDERFVAEHDEEESRSYLRERYMEVSGERWDGRWKTDTLLEKIQEKLNEQHPLNIDTTAKVETNG